MSFVYLQIITWGFFFFTRQLNSIQINHKKKDFAEAKKWTNFGVFSVLFLSCLTLVFVISLLMRISHCQTKKMDQLLNIGQKKNINKAPYLMY